MIPGCGHPVADATVIFDETGIGYVGPTVSAPPSAAEDDADVITLDTNPLDDRSVWGDPDWVTHVWKRRTPKKMPT
jgi:hypothetical protein